MNRPSSLEKRIDSARAIQPKRARTRKHHKPSAVRAYAWIVEEVRHA